MKKPKVKLVGQDGNIFNLMGICSVALRKAKQEENAKKMVNEIMKSNLYHEALSIMGEYCEIS